MSHLQRNKQLVQDFFELAFNEKRLEEAVARYIGPTYTQHNPLAADGPEGLLALGRHYIEQFPEMHLELKRLIAEDDLVAVHVHGRRTPGDPGLASIDIFRVKDGRLVEHWDVGQEVPETSANDNGMF
jgi:predicted SnoaL-like aldol condensation-catalyzing enzyme